MKAIERLYQYLNFKSLKPTALEKEIGLSNGYIGVQKKRNADMGEGILLKIIDYCRDLNPVWLLTGEGDMIKNETTNQLNQSSDSGILLKLLEEKEKKIEKLTEELRAMERKVGSLEAKLENVATLGNRTADNVSTAKRSSQSRASAPSASAPLNE